VIAGVGRQTDERAAAGLQVTSAPASSASALIFGRCTAPGCSLFRAWNHCDRAKPMTASAGSGDFWWKTSEHLWRGTHPGCPTILLVDDNPADIDLLQMAFAQNGFTGRLLIAGNGREAMGIADEVCRGLVPCPHLAVLDVNIPIFSGFDVLQRLRASPIGCDVPVAMLTSTTQASEKETAARLGATCFLEKTHDAGRLRLGR
jgi:CheY-like chemotaxis protein